MDQKYSSEEAQAKIEELKAQVDALHKANAAKAKEPFFKEERYQPETREYPAWNFACPGPSLQKWEDDGRPGMLADAPLVAVNSAIGVCPDADVWLITRQDLDDPLADFGMRMAEILDSDRHIIWMQKSVWHVHYERKMLHATAKVRCWPNRKHVFEADLMGFESRLEWSGVTPLQGVGLAISMGGKHIRVFGADMKGSGYAGIDGGPNAWVDNESTDESRRWKRDRMNIGRAIEDAARGGVLLEFAGQNWDGEVKPVPKRTAKKVTKRKKRADTPERKTLEQHEAAKTLSNPTMAGNSGTQEGNERIRQAERAIGARARKPLTESEKAGMAARAAK